MPPQTPADSLGIEAYFGLSDFQTNAAAFEKMLNGLDKNLDAYAKSSASTTKAAEDGWRSYAGTVDNALGGADKSVRDAAGGVKDMSNANAASLRTAASDWKYFSSTVVGQVMQMKSVIIATKTLVTSFLGPFKQMIGLAEEVAGLERSRKMFERMLGSSRDYNEEIGKMRAITKGIISDADLISSAFRIMSMGLADTAEQAAQVSRNVTLLAKAAGQVPTAAAALQVFSLMMANQSRLRLDAFFLSVNEMDVRMKQLMTSLSISTREAFPIAVYELMEEKVQQMGLDIENSATKVSRLNAAFKNLTDNLKMTVAPELDEFVTVLSDIFAFLSDDTIVDIARYNVALVVGMVRGATMELGRLVEIAVYSSAAVVNALKGNAEEVKRYSALILEIQQRPVGTAFMEEMRAAMIRHYGDMGAAAEDSATIQERALQQVEQAMADVEANAETLAQSIRDVWAEMAAYTAESLSKSFYAAQDAMIAAARHAEDVARRVAASIQSIAAQYDTAILNAAAARDSTIESAGATHASAMLRIEENYQRAKRDILRKYDMEESEAIRARDALALVRARRSRDSALEAAKDTFVSQKNEAGVAYAAQLVAAQKAYDQQIAVAKSAYNKQMDALKAQLIQEEAERQLALDRQEEDRERALARERGARLQAIGQKIADVYLANRDEQTAMRDHYYSMLADLRSYYENAAAYYAALQSLRQQATGGLITHYPRRQTGGYAGYGTYKLGEQGAEFVLSSDTTKMLERLTGGMLSQSKVLSAVASRSNASAMSSQSQTVNHVVSGEVATQVEVAVNRSISGMEGRINAALSKSLGSLFRGVRV